MNYFYATPEQIEAVRGHFFVKPSPPYREPRRMPLLPLSAAAQEKVAANRALVHQHMPEMVAVIREMHEAGLIDGWRSVEKVELLAEKGNRNGNA